MTRHIIAAAVALTIGTGIGVKTQTSGSTTPGHDNRAAGATATPATELTLIGCVEFEQDYRKRMAAGRGGALGSGVGAADEFVLTNVRPATAATGTTGSAPTGRAGGAAAAATPAGGGGVYTLTGPMEKNLKRDVGRQVEIIGTLENAGERRTGAQVTDISNLPRLVISTWHPVGDFCPA